MTPLRTTLPLMQPANDNARTSTPALPAKWNHRRWGTLDDPIHKSHMSTLIGEFSCTKQFQFERLREARHEERATCSGKTEMGTAIHETIARALQHEATRDAILGGYTSVTHDQLRRVIAEEYEKCTDGREVVWYGKDTYTAMLEVGTAMAYGLLHDMHRHVAAVELVEGGFIAQLADFFIEGHIDLVYRPRSDPSVLAVTDWKSGKQKPHQITLDHGYESGFYSAAVERGLFVPTTLAAAWRADAVALLAGDESAALRLPFDAVTATALATAHDARSAMHTALRALMRMKLEHKGLPAGVRTFGEFPSVLRLTHLAEYVPYSKKGSKTVERPEDVEFWSRVYGREVSPREKVYYEKGMMRGGAWCEIRRGAEDVQRLERMLRAIVGWVRMGKFVESTGEKCARCAFKGPCLTDGYQLQGDDAKQLAGALRGTDFASDADDLSIED